jgi:diaminohydroxyphosphoribosylaminopyrimidine deaminase/5-amino-6-(5-phosphoribosylamino)uracil reductase
VEDPDPRVRGAGFARLRAAGIEVAVGPLADEARELHAGFFLRLASGRPLVALKSATSLDGRIATRTGESRWISGPAALRRAHLLRASHDAVMVGIGTALADDPQLTCRLPGMAERSPVRIVVDRRLRLPLTHKLVADARRVPTWIVTAAGAPPARGRPYAEAGCTLVEVEGGERELDLAAALRELGARGLTRVLVEGGGHLAAGLLRAGLVDRIHAVRAGLAIGGDGLPVIRPFGVERLADAPRFARRETAPCGDDVYEVWARA